MNKTSYFSNVQILPELCPNPPLHGGGFGQILHFFFFLPVVFLSAVCQKKLLVIVGMVSLPLYTQNEIYNLVPGEVN